ARWRCSLGGAVRSRRSGARRSGGRRGDRLHCGAGHFPLVGDERTRTARPSALAEAIRISGLQRGARSKRKQASSCSTASCNRAVAAPRSCSSRGSAHHIFRAGGRKFYATCPNLGVISPPPVSAVVLSNSSLAPSLASRRSYKLDRRVLFSLIASFGV